MMTSVATDEALEIDVELDDAFEEEDEEGAAARVSGVFRTPASREADNDVDVDVEVDVEPYVTFRSLLWK